MNTRKKLILKAVVCLVILSVLLGALNITAFASSPAAAKKPLAKNVIVMIADGRGFNTLLTTSYYEYGKANGQIYTRFPFQAAMSTYDVYKPGFYLTIRNNYDVCHNRVGYDPNAAWTDFEYMKYCYTDSAAAATAMATGVKTYDGGLGVDIDGNPQTNVVQAADKLGKSTGVITSVPFDHATPAGFVTHNVSRNNYSQIADEMINQSGLDVIMGAGNPDYNTDGDPVATPNYYYMSQAIWDSLEAGTAGGADPWTLIQTRAEFQALETGDTPDRVIGISQVYDTLQQNRSGDAYAAPGVVPFIETVPTLAEMANGALNVLDNNPKGFFLMIEGGEPDWAAHAGQEGRLIEDHMSFDDAVQAVVDWVNANSNWGETLLIVTNDHETGYIWGPGSEEAQNWIPIVNNGALQMPGLEFDADKKGAELEHSNSLVPVFAKGDAGRLINQFATSYDPVRGKYLDNTDLAKIVFMAMGK